MPVFIKSLNTNPHGMTSTLAIRVAAFALAIIFAHNNISRADVITVGDVDPNISDAGVPDNPDIIIGNTGVGGLFMDIAPPLSGPLQFLTSDTGIIGNQGNSVGAAVFDDFGVRWEIANSLTVGNLGQGFLDVFESAAIQVGGPLPSTAPTIIGEGSTGQGIMRLDGVASRLTTGPLTVGDEGVGTLEATNSASFVSGDAIIGSEDGSIGTVTLTDLGSRWTVGDPNNIATLTIGNGSTTGTPTNAYGTLNVNTDAIVQTSGAVIVNETGIINLQGGLLRDIGGSTLSNGGVIRGDGSINSAMTITASGELRNAAAVANQRERLLVTGPVLVTGDSDPNFESPIDGLIETQGGEMEFHDLVTNNGAIVARDGILRFRGQEVSSAATDLDNNGLLVLGENTTVYGSIDNTGGLIVDVTGAAVAFPSVFGDIVFTQAPLVAAISSGETAAISADTSTLKLIVDEDPGALSIFGNLVLDGSATFDLDYVSGEPSQAGDSFSVVSASSISGTFGNSQVVANGRFWDVDVIGNEVMVTATALTVGSADFNSDGRVDGLDFMEWQIGYPLLYNLDDLARWEAAYGESTSSPPPVAAVAAVPEPSTLLLALSTLGLCFRPRDKARRRSS